MEEQKGGLCLVFVPHTTAAVTINEGADPDVVDDIIRQLEKVAKGDYKHREGNGPAHFKASLLGNSLVLPVVNGKLDIGTWQRIFFCEFDGPRSRQVYIKIVS